MKLQAITTLLLVLFHAYSAPAAEKQLQEFERTLASESGPGCSIEGPIPGRNKNICYICRCGQGPADQKAGFCVAPGSELLERELSYLKSICKGNQLEAGAYFR